MDKNPITEYVTCAPLVDDLSCHVLITQHSAQEDGIFTRAKVQLISCRFNILQIARFSPNSQSMAFNRSATGSMNARNSILSRVSGLAFWQYERTQQHPFTGLAFWRAPFRWVSGHLLRLHFFQFYGTRYIAHVHIKKAGAILFQHLRKFITTFQYSLHAK
ncbi:hypothetical protein F5877DRAFT_65875 [Lentinula edodes]|nr:hypothetical protein F5877DRAFT_65875 [Lentinula edodes]